MEALLAPVLVLILLSMALGFAGRGSGVGNVRWVWRIAWKVIWATGRYLWFYREQRSGVGRVRRPQPRYDV